MPLNAKYLASHVMPGTANKAQTIELFGDYNCPFACKLFKKFQDGWASDKFQVVFVNVVQPWHGFQSSVLHECSLAVARIQPDAFWKASRVLYDHIEDFYDGEVYDLSKRQLVEKVSALLESEAGVSSSAIVELVQTPGPGNAGSAVAKDLKYLTRYGRTLGVHVTPSVFLNGIYMSTIESSTDLDEIVRILESNL